MEEKSKTTRTCDVCKESYDSDNVTPYIIFLGDALAPVGHDIYVEPICFKMCVVCAGRPFLEILEKVVKKKGK